MVLASHYVIKSISIVLEKKDLADTEAVFEKFSSRYSEDRDLQKICDNFRAYLGTRNREELEKIKKTLERLNEARKKESVGGTKLWFKDRRPGTMQLIKVT
ncbi:MAG: hypothetical protein JW778_06620 [Candidatus Altiarchaeota archaeon]|nr:hypothetical protein [Candidatus Altiarchaeota archaeon]